MTTLEDDDDTAVLLLEDTLEDMTPPPGGPTGGSLGALTAGTSPSSGPVADADVAVAVAAPSADLSLGPGGAQLALWIGPSWSGLTFSTLVIALIALADAPALSLVVEME
jgi:hypothetical protein